ncbi:MAG: biotin-dependent carboxyltransferase family protein [Acidobacteriota bacterium]|jgi:antagonist of KipI|nr:biotin-dependent carboxyltransferase family protein [Acidobacteriota bacterium]
MSITINKAGILDTFQDLGRNGFRKLGINPNGAMDKTAVRLINILMGNDENEAVLEMHFPASEIKFNEDTIFSLGGANFDAELDNKPIENWKLQTAQKDSIIKFYKKSLGNRCYLAIKGGFKLKKWLNSSSTNLTAEIGGFEGRKLKKGDKINFNKSLSTLHSPLSTLKIGQSLIPFYSQFPTVRIITGAEYQNLTALSELEFLSQSFSISANSNRMGFRLEGKPLHLLYKKDLISSAVNFGTIQLLPDGQLIILMADHQTTGGYPRIAHIIEQDLPLAAQLGAGDGIGFHIISLEEAENLKIEFEKDLSFLKMGVRFKGKSKK